MKINKKFFVLILIAIIILYLFGPYPHQVCIKESNKCICRQINPYGIFNESSKNDRVYYETSLSAIIASIVTTPTIVLPLFLLGTSLYEPVEPRFMEDKCEINQ